MQLKLQPTKVSEKRLITDQNLNYGRSVSVESASSCVQRGMLKISGDIYQLWNQYEILISVSPSEVLNFFRTRYIKLMGEQCGNNLIKQTYHTSNLAVPPDEEILTSHKFIAKKLRETQQYVRNDSTAIEDVESRPETRPIVFEECYLRTNEDRVIRNMFELSSKEDQLSTNPSTTTGYVGTHLFVLVHGFQASSNDLRLFRNVIDMYATDAQYLLSCANERDTEVDIFTMGKRLADEVLHYIKEWCPHNLSRISFVGHSLGGLIVRSALPHLEDYKRQMHCFLSLSSPHLGYMYSTSKIVSAGMWVIRKWRKSTSL